MRRAFISHSSKDDRFLPAIKGDLVGRGYSETVTENHNAEADDVFWPRVERGIGECDAFVLVVSHVCVMSSWVNRGVQLARSLRREVFVFRIDDCPLPLGIDVRELIDYTIGRVITLDPDIYVSYAWGEDNTPNGQQREETVRRLCDTVRSCGYEIGRDRDQTRPGDSITDFARQIASAKRIVAVISDKSLNSIFCMAHELFSAYQRCGYRRAEFQAKVIALILDDARPHLKDAISRLTLTAGWKEKSQEISRLIRLNDPDHRSQESWREANLVTDMVPYLPDLLSALTDTIMKRGFDEIVQDNFREVIGRLATLQRGR